MTERILILDFGSQVTQLIARRVRESGVYSEIHPCTMKDREITAFKPAAVILSGGPSSVTESDTPRAPASVFTLGVPVLGICYGQQTMCAQLGGEVAGSEHREFGQEKRNLCKKKVQSSESDGENESAPTVAHRHDHTCHNFLHHRTHPQES